MRNYEIENEMYRLAIELIKKRYPDLYPNISISLGKYRMEIRLGMENSHFHVLGTCNELPFHYIYVLHVAVTNAEEIVKFVELKELQPYHWLDAYPADELDHWKE